jgi:hypothetical protein
MKAIKDQTERLLLFEVGSDVKCNIKVHILCKPNCIELCTFSIAILIYFLVVTLKNLYP